MNYKLSNQPTFLILVHRNCSQHYLYTMTLPSLKVVNFLPNGDLHLLPTILYSSWLQWHNSWSQLLLRQEFCSQSQLNSWIISLFFVHLVLLLNKNEKKSCNALYISPIWAEFWKEKNSMICIILLFRSIYFWIGR